jgi:hypothetical protein
MSSVAFFMPLLGIGNVSPEGNKKSTQHNETDSRKKRYCLSLVHGRIFCVFDFLNGLDLATMLSTGDQ